MNYLKEMNGFMNWLETNPLSATTQALWFHLLHINNKAGWREWFTTSNTTLQAKIGVTENTLIKHRDVLIALKRIEYKSQGRKAGQYRLISFETPVSEQEPSEKPVPEPTPQETQEVDPKMKNAFELFENKVARSIGTIEAQRIGYMVDDYGEEKVMEAMKLAFRNKGSNVGLNYIEAILSNPFSQKRKEKQQYGNKQSSQHRHSVPSNDEGSSSKIAFLGNATGRIRRKG
ncbi:DnaD domain protein [Bacillus atrophaeus]|uniref:DnaD domain protein n=1 Tax=Bacillus atrophaeus TaxID=1452 RepID=UPI00227F23EC|nr:DnaD domain protein [Bacillus atrophaeus]MCY8932536.1 DnaD domain protein [Bacillus atrophaeus]MCY8942326.1 DnaD domain protein [Bacillus atrophaeus]